MSVNEKMVQDIVQEVVAKMQISSDVAGKKGVFSDMNEAIEASKKTQKIVARMSMDQREAIISNIRQKIRENAEILARMGVEETGMGNVGHKILKHQLVAEKTPGTEDITTTAWSGDRGLTLIEMGPFGVIGAITPCTNPSETVLCNTCLLYTSNIIGCVEPQKSGKTEGWHDAAFFNMCRPLELVFSNGMDKGVRIGPATGNVEDMTTFEQFYDAYKKQMDYAIQLLVNADNAIDMAHAERCPLPFLSSMVDDCMKVGKTVQELSLIHI